MYNIYILINLISEKNTETGPGSTWVYLWYIIQLVQRFLSTNWLNRVEYLNYL